MTVLRFEWDRDMAARRLRKHGVTFEEACTALADTLSVTILDPSRAASIASPRAGLFNAIEVLPFKTFVQRLWAGDLGL